MVDFYTTHSRSLSLSPCLSLALFLPNRCEAAVRATKRSEQKQRKPTNGKQHQLHCNPQIQSHTCRTHTPTPPIAACANRIRIQKLYNSFRLFPCCAQKKKKHEKFVSILLLRRSFCTNSQAAMTFNHEHTRSTHTNAHRTHKHTCGQQDEAALRLRPHCASQGYTRRIDEHFPSVAFCIDQTRTTVPYPHFEGISKIFLIHMWEGDGYQRTSSLSEVVDGPTPSLGSLGPTKNMKNDELEALASR